MQQPTHTLIHGLSSLVLPLLTASSALAQLDQLEKRDIPQPLPNGTELLGSEIAFDGATLVAGSKHYDISGTDDGEAYIWDMSGGGLGAMTTLSSPDGPNQGRFGSAVAVDGSTLVIGEEHSNVTLASAGTVHVYELVAGAWTLQQTLALGVPTANDAFGASVDLDGDRLVVGSPGHGVAGGAFVFDRVGGTWGQSAHLVANDLVFNDQFGRSVALSGDTVIVGAPQHFAGGVAAGAAYVHRLSGGAWGQEQKLTPTAGSGNLWFGISVDVENDLALVGATQGNNPGDAHVFARSGTSWATETILTAWVGNGAEGFGESVSLDGGRAVVGAWQDTTVNFAEGSAYVFDRDGGAWTGVARLISSTPAIVRFGLGTAVSGDTAFVGAPNETPGGVIYQYDLNPGIGSKYCTAEPNSTGQPGEMYANGSLLAMENNLQLYAADLPDHSFGYFLVGRGSGSVFPVAGSDGRLCLGGAPIGRYVTHILNSDVFGWFATEVQMTSTPTPTGLVAIQAGETWNFQAWHRDAVGGVVTSNFTDAISITFQ